MKCFTFFLNFAKQEKMSKDHLGNEQNKTCQSLGNSQPARLVKPSMGPGLAQY